MGSAYLANSHLMEIFEPTVAGFGFVKVEKLGVHYFFRVDFAAPGLDNLGIVVEGLDDVEELGLLLIVDLEGVSSERWDRVWY